MTAMLSPIFFAASAILATSIICHFAMPLGVALGLLDFPDDSGGRKQHARVTPLVGGVAVAGVMLAATAGTLWLPSGQGAEVERHIVWLGIAATSAFVIGVADDRFGLSVRARLGIVIVALLLTLITAPDFVISFIHFASQPTTLLLGLLSVPFTLLCLVGLLNAVNMADGKNGIVISLGLVWSLMLFRWLPSAMAPVLAALVGALAILLWFNMRNRLFLGDGGSYTLSAVFGLLAIYAYNHRFAAIGAEDIVLLFTIPVLDTLRLLVVRLGQRRSPFHAGRDHLHHYLYAKVGWPAGLGVYIGLVAVPNFGAALFPGTATAWLGATLIAYAVVLTASQRSQATA